MRNAIEWLLVLTGALLSCRPEITTEDERSGVAISKPTVTLSSENFATFTEYKLSIAELRNTKSAGLGFEMSSQSQDHCGQGVLEPVENNEHGFIFQTAGKWYLCIIQKPTGEKIWTKEIDVTGNSIPLASDDKMFVKQNSSAILTINASDPDADLLTLIIKQKPQKGDLSINGTEVTYTVKDATFSGEDGFTFVISDGMVESEEAKIMVTVTPLESGNYEFIENYEGGVFSLSGWESKTSELKQANSAVQDFTTTTYRSTATDARRIYVAGDINWYSGDDFYQAVFSALPVDGSGNAMFDYYWSSDLIKIPECVYDVEMTSKLVAPKGGTHNLILLNYRITADSQRNGSLFTGYQLLWNSGGSKSLTLSRFDGANEKALAFTDRWPDTTFGNENNNNPVEHGPYKGWNYYNGTWQAGGNLLNSPSTSREVLIAIHYRYDLNSGDTTIGWEARPTDGVDNTPSSYDKQRTLTGNDSLAPGGGFGFMPITYHNPNSISNPDLKIVEMTLKCLVP